MELKASEVAPRAQLMSAMLRCAGESGFADVSVEQVCKLAAASPAAFDLHFGGREECFALAYEQAGEVVWERLAAHLMLEREEGVKHALAELVAAVTDSPVLARSMLLEVNGAGAQATTKRLELFDRLAGLLDSVLSSAPGAPDPGTRAVFLVGGVNGVLCRALRRGEPMTVEQLETISLVYMESGPDLR